MDEVYIVIDACRFVVNQGKTLTALSFELQS